VNVNPHERKNHVNNFAKLHETQTFTQDKCNHSSTILSISLFLISRARLSAKFSESFCIIASLLGFSALNLHLYELNILKIAVAVLYKVSQLVLANQLNSVPSFIFQPLRFSIID
jgi:hypothetical protein